MKHLDTIKVLSAGGVYTGVTLADVDIIIKIVAGLLTIAYVGRKWYKMEKR